MRTLRWFFIRRFRPAQLHFGVAFSMVLGAYFSALGVVTLLS
jgi:hypothetical protein